MSYQSPDRKQGQPLQPSPLRTQTTWHLVLLGRPSLTGPTLRLELERKTALLLAYLAIEGECPRSRLAEWLWPDSSELRARNSLRQLLFKLRTKAHATVVLGEEVLSVSPHLTTDAVQVRRAMVEGRFADALHPTGELLGSVTLDDCPEAHDWLLQARESIQLLRCRAAHAEAERAERGGDLGAAVAALERLLELVPTSEDALRELMRLHFLMGNRLAALDAFERCRRMLSREMDARPSPSTLELARLIERHLPVVHSPHSAAPPPLLLSLKRPPLLVGRRWEWALMEEAWKSRRCILLLGEPGGGKSRLALDFANSKGTYELVKCAPGDRHVPYAAMLRCLKRAVMRGGAPSWPRWVRQELVRVIPELSEPDEDLAPPRGTRDRLRFYQAIAMAFQWSMAGVETLIVDDVHFSDRATLDSSSFLMSCPERHVHPRVIACCSICDLPSATGRAIRRLEAAGELAVIRLRPLGPEAVAALLESLELPQMGQSAATVARFTGGNPLFITEMLQHMAHAGSLGRGWPERPPIPDRVRALVKQRLTQLSPSAHELLHLRILSGEPFSESLATETLGLAPQALNAASAELIEAGIMHERALIPGVVEEMIRSSLPASAPSLPDSQPVVDWRAAHRPRPD